MSCLSISIPPLVLITPRSRVAPVSSMAVHLPSRVSPFPSCTPDLLSQESYLITSEAPPLILSLYQMSTRERYPAIGGGDDVGGGRGGGEGAVKIGGL